MTTMANNTGTGKKLESTAIATTGRPTPIAPLTKPPTINATDARVSIVVSRPKRVTLAGAESAPAGSAATRNSTATGKRVTSGTPFAQPVLLHAPEQQIDAVLPEKRLALEYRGGYAPVAGGDERIVVLLN